jgi:hypothetical protein
MNETIEGQLKKLFGNLRHRETSEAYIAAEDRLQRTYGGPWNFNQAIGWIRLYAAGSHVGGHLWWVDAKRPQRNMRNKMFRLMTPSNILPTFFTPAHSSDEIYRETLKAIKNLSRESLKGRYVDLEAFENIGPFVNWQELLKVASKSR